MKERWRKRTLAHFVALQCKGHRLLSPFRFESHLCHPQADYLSKSLA